MAQFHPDAQPQSEAPRPEPPATEWPPTARPPQGPRDPAPPEQTDALRGRPSLFMPMLIAVLGFLVLVAAILVDEPISVGSALGVLLLLSAALRFEIARRT